MVSYKSYKGDILVTVDGRRTGAIIKCDGGYCYRISGRHRGNVFATIEEVKRSIEGR